MRIPEAPRYKPSDKMFGSVNADAEVCTTLIWRMADYCIATDTFQFHLSPCRCMKGWGALTEEYVWHAANRWQDGFPARVRSSTPQSRDDTPLAYPSVR